MNLTPGDVDTDEVAKRYDTWSFVYDLADRAGPLSRSERAWRNEVAECMRGVKGWVLDAACGTGIMCRHFEATGFGGRLLAIDASRRMVHKVKAQARATRLECSVMLADVTRLPIKSGSVAGVVCVFSLTTVTRPAAALEEFLRVTSNHSILVVLDNERPRGLLPRLIYPALVPISRAFCHTYIDRDVGALLDRSPGLVVERTRSYAGGMAALYSCRKTAQSSSVRQIYS